jgi:hypothetical protein
VTGDIYGYSASTIFAAVKKYPDMFMENHNATNNYNSTSFTQLAYTPPPCRRTTTLPKSASYDFPINSTIFNPRPFWTAMQGCEETILNISKYNDPGIDPLAREMFVEMSGRVLYITVTSGSTILASSGISSIRYGSGYTHGQYANTINQARLPWFAVPSSSYRPLLAASGNINDYHVYVDDTTWWNGTNPTDYGIGSPTPINYGYREPLFDTLRVDLMGGGGLELNTWVRRRCNWSVDGGTTRNDLYLNPCLPPDGARVEPSIDLQCEADNVIEGNWLIAYGCLSTVCKTEYYIQAERCGCSTVPACSDDGSSPKSIAHPFNRAPTSDCSVLSTPLLYICESNIHPDCDIPFLVKVPYQFVCEDGNDNCYFGTACNNTEFCYQGRCPPHTDLPESNKWIGYSLPEWACVHGDTQYGYMNAGYDGWCQYVDPTNITRVSRLKSQELILLQHWLWVVQELRSAPHILIHSMWGLVILNMTH